MATNHHNRLPASTQQAAAQAPAKIPPKNALAPIEPNDFGEVLQFAQVAVRCGVCSVKNVEEATLRILYGRSLGMTAFQSIMGIDVIQGRLSLKAGTVAAMIDADERFAYRVVKWTVDECVIRFYENGEDLGESVFTLADAKRAKVHKPDSNWEKYPKAMLFARAITQGARAYCPAVFFGPVYSTEEMIDGVETVDITPTREPEDVIDVEAEADQPSKEQARVKATPTPKPERPAEPQAPPAKPKPNNFAEKVSKIDAWADAAGRKFESEGQTSFAQAGPVIAAVYEILSESGMVKPGLKNYRQQVNSIAEIDGDWPQVKEILSGAAAALMAELTQPPEESQTEEIDPPFEPGSEG